MQQLHQQQQQFQPFEKSQIVDSIGNDETTNSLSES
jgi:hypothetical protein